MRSDIPVATAGSLNPVDALILWRVRYMSMSFALSKYGVAAAKRSEWSRIGKKRKVQDITL